jgi:hypothetical protein
VTTVTGGKAEVASGVAEATSTSKGVPALAPEVVAVGGAPRE